MFWLVRRWRKLRQYTHNCMTIYYNHSQKDMGRRWAIIEVRSLYPRQKTEANRSKNMEWMRML